MAISGFEFPRVTVRQEFTAAAAGTDSTLPVCVIGPQYDVHSYERYGQRQYVGDLESGTTSFAYPGKQQSGVVDTQHVFGRIPDAKIVVAQQVTLQKISGAQGTLVKCLKQDGTTPLSLLTVGSKYKRASSVATNISAGDVVQLTDGSDQKIVDILDVRQADGVYCVLLLKGSLTANEIQGATIAITRDVRIAATSATATSATFAGLTTDIINSQGSTVTGLDIIGGALHIEYRQRVSQFGNRLGVVSGGADAVQACQQVFGDCSMANPLGLGVLMAARTSGSNFVYFMSVAQDTAEAYEYAMDFIGKDDTVYSVVIQTEDPVIIQQCLAQVKQQSQRQVPMVKILWYGISNPTDGSISNNTELINYILDAKCTADRRAAMVYADNAYYNGQLVPNYIVAAAVAGMRASEAPHRPLSNLEITSGITVGETHGLTSSSLKVLGSNGIWLVGQDYAGRTISRRQLTTAAADDVNYDQQSLTTNVDAIVKALRHIGQDMVGNSNISPALLSILRADVNALMSQYLVATSGQLVGPQLLSYSLVSLYQDPVVLDRVYAHVTGQPPRPFNQFDITFRLV